MRAGCQQSQGGAYPAFQDQSNVCALTSLQDSNATSIPGVHLATGMQYNMVATYSKTETYSPAQWQQGYTQSQQNFQGLYQLDPQASTTFTGFQHPEPRNSIWISQNSHQQVHRKANPVRQSGYNGGQHRECSSTKGSNLNIDTGLQPRLELNVGSPDGTSSATLRGVQGDSLRVAAQTFPTQTLCSRREMIIQKHSLLTSLLKGNPPDDRYFATTPSSKDTNAKIGRNTNTLSSNERFDKIQHVRSSPTHNGRKTTPQNLDHLGRTHSTPCQQQVSALLRSESYPEVFPVEESQPPTDDDIQAFILRSFEDFRTNGKNGLIPLHSNSTPQPGCIPKSNSTAHVSTNFISGKDDMDLQILDCAVKEQGITAIGQIFEEDHMKGSKVKAELTPMSEKMSDCATSASKKHSTGTLASAVGNSKHASKTESTERAMMGLDSSVNKQLDVSKTTQHIGKPFHSSDCKDKTFDSCNNEIFHSILSNKYLDAGEITLRGSLTALKELIACPENVETVAEMDKCPKVILQRHWNGDIDNIHLFASTEYPPILGKVAATCMKNEDEGPVVVNAVPPVTLDGLTEKHHTSLLIIKGDANLKPVQAVWLGSVQGVTDVSEHLQTQSSTVVSDKETSEATTHIENQDPEENTDDQKHCNITCTGVNAQCKENALADIRIHNVVSMASHQGEHLYNHTGGAREDPRSLYQQSDALVPLNENKVKGQASLSKGVGQELLCVRDPKYDDISDDDHMSQLATEPPVLEREDLSFPACYEDISDGSPDVENGSAERQSVTQVPEPNKKQSSFENEKYGHVQCQVLKDDDDEDDDDDDDDWIVIPVCMSDLKFEPEGKYCESPDDSGDDAEETQSDTALMHRDPHQSSHSYKIPEFNTIESFKRHYRAQFQMDFKVELQNRGESDSEAEESSDTEDSCDYTSGSECNKLTASRQLWLEGSSTDDTGSGKKDEDGQNRSLNNLGPIQKLKQLIKPSTASNNVQNQTSEPKISKEDEVIVIDDDTDSELDQSSCSDNSKHSPGSQQKRHSPDTVGGETVKRIKSNGDSDNEQHYGQGSETIIILDCDTDDDKDQDYNITNRKSLSPSASAEGDAPCLEQMIHPPQTVSIIHETTEETSLSSMGSSLLRPQSKYDTQLEEALEDAGPDLSHSKGKHGQLIKTKDGPGHVQHKSSRSRMSEQRVNTKRQLSSEEAISDKAVFSTKRRRSAEAVDCQQGNGEILAPKTTAGTSKKIESSEKNIRHSHRKERGSFVSKAKPDSDKHSTKNKGQTSVEKSRLSSPSQTSPSTLFSSPSSTSRDRKSGQELEEVLRSTHNGLHKVARPGPGPGRPEARPGPGPGRPEARPGPGPGRPEARPGPGPGRPEARPGPGPGRPEARPGPGPGHNEARPGPGHSEARPGPGRGHSEARPGPGRGHSEARPGPGRGHSEARPGPGPHRPEARPGPGPHRPEARPGPGPHRPEARPGPGPHRPEARPGPGPHRPEARPGPGPHRPEARTGPGPKCHEARPGPSYCEARPLPKRRERRSRLCHKDGRKSHQRESAPRQRHISVHPLMERSKCDAVQWTKAITRDSVRKQRYSVPDGYRGAENPEVDEPEFDY